MLIVHRCTDCGHPDIWASTGTTAGPARAGVPTPPAARRRHCSGSTIRGEGSCHGDGAGACTWGPPTTMREWRAWPDNTEITEVRPPGTGPNTHKTCDCDDCKRHYHQLTGTDLFTTPTPTGRTTS